jgi:hypothetical protein
VALRTLDAQANTHHITLHWMCSCQAQSSGILGPCAATWVVRCSPAARAGAPPAALGPVPSPVEVQECYEKANRELFLATQRSLDPRLLGEVLACDPRRATHGLGVATDVAKQGETSAEEVAVRLRSELCEDPGPGDMEPRRVAYCPMCGDRLFFDGTCVWGGMFGGVLEHLCGLRAQTVVQALWDRAWSGRTTYLMVAPVER